MKGMLRIVSIKSSSKNVLLPWNFAPTRLYSAAASPLSSSTQSANNDGKTTHGATLTKEQIFECRDVMRAEIQETCVKICRVGELTKDEIDSGFQRIDEFTNAMNIKLGTKHSYADLIDYCLSNNLSITPQLYERYMRSSEFNSLVSNLNDLRPHLFAPAAVLVVKQLKSEKLKADPKKRFQLVSDFLNRYLTNFTLIAPISVIVDHLAFEEDIDFVINIIDAIDSLNQKQRDFATKIVFCLLRENKMDRLKELMECKLKTDTDIRIFTNRVTTQLLRRLKSIKLDSPASSTELNTIAQVIAAGFKTNESDTTGGQALASILGSSTINDDILKRVIYHLMEDSKVLVSKAEINRIETQLRDANLPSRAKLISRLRQKTSTHQRWMKTEDLDELIREAESLEQRDATAMHPFALNTLVWLLPNFQLLEKKLNNVEAKSYRLDFNNALNATINYAHLSRQHEAFDKLWELRSLKSYYPEQIILFALSYFERDMTSKADDILASFKESGALIDDKTLNWVVSSDFMRTITSEETVKDFIQLLANHFSISTEWDRRLTAAVQLNDLHKAIDEGKLEEVSGKIEQMGEYLIKNPSTSFVLIDQLKAAIQANNSQVFMRTKEFIESRGDPYTVVLYIGLSFLELNDQRWPKMLNKIKHIPTDILRELVKRETKAKRADVLHTLFNVLNKPDTSSVELEILLEETVKLYFLNNDLEGLRKVFDQVRNSSFYLSAKLKVKIESNIKTLEKQSAIGSDEERQSSATTPQPPKSSSPSENNHPLK